MWVGFLIPGDKWDSSDEEDLDGIKELGQSKWSKDFDEDTEKSKHADGSTHALSGLAQTYGTRRKALTWGDRVWLLVKVQCVVLALYADPWLYFSSCLSLCSHLMFFLPNLCCTV